MRDKKTKIIGLDVSSKIFESYEEAVKTANSLKIFASRMIDEENAKDNSYSAYIIIGVSENNSHHGEIILEKNGKRGRPKKVFMCNSDKKDVTNPHLHILIYGNPADMICNRLSAYLYKKYKQRASWKKYCERYSTKALAYIFKQSKSIRTVKKNKDHILDSDYFQALFDSIDSHERFIFTKNEYEDLQELLENKEVLEIKDILNELVCNKPNKPITYIKYNYKLLLNKLDDSLLKYFVWNNAP